MRVRFMHQFVYRNCLAFSTSFICILLLISNYMFYPTENPTMLEKELGTIQQLNTSMYNIRLKCYELKQPELEHEESKKIAGMFSENWNWLRFNFTFRIHPRLVVIRLHSPICGVNAEDTAGSVFVHFIKSRIPNKERRDEIRTTWAAVKTVGYSRHEVIFIVDSTTHHGEQSEIEDESQRHGDILQPALYDGHTHILLKFLAGMQWASTFLRPHWMYTSGDDSVMFNPFNLVKMMKRVLPPQRFRPCYEQLPIICLSNFMVGDNTSRKPNSKRFVSADMYPLDRWPTHCRDGVYAMPVHMTSQLLEISRRTRYLLMEDVWVTGLVRMKLNQGDYNIYAAPYAKRNGTQRSTDFLPPFSQIIVRHPRDYINATSMEIVSEMENEWREIIPNSGSCF